MLILPGTIENQRTLRRSSRLSIALGTVFLFLGVARGISNGRLLEPGSNNRAAVIAGLWLLLAGMLLHHPRLVRLHIDVLRTCTERTPALLSRLKSRPILYVWLGLWFGLLTGLVESGYRAYHALENPWPHSLWLGPLAYVVPFGSVGLVLSIMGHTRHGAPSLRVASGLFLTLTLSAWLFVVAPRIHGTASVLLAAGLAVQLSQLFARYAHLACMVVIASGRAALFIVAALMMWSLGPDALNLHARPEALAPSGSGRNVLLVVLDTVRASDLSLYGYSRRTTPNLERWARRGVVFESAMSTAPWTLPSHTGMFTGRWTVEFSDKVELKLDGRYPTIAEVLRDRGYSTAGFVGNSATASRQSGLARGFQRYEDFQISLGEAVVSTSVGRALVTADWIRNALGHHEILNRKTASSINRSFIHWLDQNGDRPFFAFLNYFDAHEPYMPPEEHARPFRSGPRLARGRYVHEVNHADHADWRSLSAAQVAQERALYDGAIASIDQKIGNLLDMLDVRGLLSTTVVMVTSDHGEAFGEHDVFGHGHSLYIDQIHVPLLILAPGAKEGGRVSNTVSLRDIPNTVLDLAGVRGNSPFPGSSLARFWRPSVASIGDIPMPYFLPAGYAPRDTPLAKGNMRSVVANPFHYILNGDGAEEIYNFRTDPLELQNLVGTPAGDGLIDRFRRIPSKSSK